MNMNPLCRCCGKPIRKRTAVVFIKAEQSEYDKPTKFWRYAYTNGGPLPTTKAEAQRLVNEQVVSVRRSHEGSTISAVHVWDGVTYESRFFCTGNCAKDFGYLAAEVLPTFRTKAYDAAAAKQRGA